MSTQGRPRKQEQEPASSEITEVGPGVLRLQIPIQFTGLGHVNSYALIDDRGATIVDAGMPGKATWQALTARLRDAGLTVRDVHTVIVTHSHPDHFGSAGRLAHEAGAELVTERRFHTWLEPRRMWASAAREHAEPAATTRPAPAPVAPGHGDACSEIVTGLASESDESTEDGPIEDDTGFFTGRTRTTPWGGSPIPQRNIWAVRLARWHLMPGLRPAIPTRRVRGGDRLQLAGREWVALHTPGHTSDHLCLFDPEAGLLISGDHVLPTITPHVPGLSPLPDPLGSYLSSLESLRGLEVGRVLPAHGHPFDDLPGRIDSIEAHHAGRLNELKVIGQELGRASVVEYSKRLFRKSLWGMMAESETYAHLEYLRRRGEAERVDADGVASYEVAAPDASDAEASDASASGSPDSSPESAPD